MLIDKRVIAATLAAVLAGCASIDVTREDAEGNETKISYWTAFKNIKDFSGQYGDLDIRFGNSTIADMCAIYPGLDGCE